MLDDLTLDHLRRSATLAAVFPVTLHLHGSTGLLLEVTRPPWKPSTTHHTVPPCNFRAALAKAWSARRHGGRFGLRGFSAAEQPHVRIVLPEGGWTDSLAVHHVPLCSDLLHCFPTTAPLHRCEDVASDLGLHTCHDPLLDVTLVHTTMTGPHHASEPLLDALAQLVADEAEATLHA